MSKVFENESYDPKDPLTEEEKITAIAIIMNLSEGNKLHKEDLAYLEVLNNRLNKEQGIDL